MNALTTQHPFFEIEMMLTPPDITFKPSLSDKFENNLYELFNNLTSDIMNQCMLIPRVAEHQDEPYYQSKHLIFLWVDGSYKKYPRILSLDGVE